MGQRAIRSWISRHSYHSAEQIVKNKKLDHRVEESQITGGTALVAIARAGQILLLDRVQVRRKVEEIGKE